MRRSAAPSQLHAKRPRFNPPFNLQNNAKTSSGDPAVESTSSTNVRSTEEILKLISSSRKGTLPSNSESKGSSSAFKCVRSTSPSTSASHSSGASATQFSRPTSPAIAVQPTNALDDELTNRNKDTEDNSYPKHDSYERIIEVRDEVRNPSKNENTVPDDSQKSPHSLPTKPRSKGLGRVFRCPTSATKALAPHNASNHSSRIDSTSTDSLSGNSDEPKTFYYNIVWCKLSKKKHKKWEGDAILRAKGRSVTLFDTDGKEIGKGSGFKVNELATMSEGHTLVVGGKEIEVMSVMKEEDFESGRCFQTAAMVKSSPMETIRTKSSGAAKPFVKPQLSGMTSEAQTRPASPVLVRPKFDPTAPDALVMPRPTSAQQAENRGQQIVDVVVDPHVAYHLRPHQRAGITFLYECVMGMKSYTGLGAILADEMGLGKTLQCISLIWTLYKQGPFNGKPVIRRVLVITPGSLVKNWVREFRKWLGNERLKVYAVNGEQKAETFARSTVYPVMIISYEMLIRNFEAVQAVKFDLVVCDEGHRLKNTNIKTTSYMMNLGTRRRIVLTGTPVQNDLKELYSIVEFSNPGVLGNSSAFHHVYEAPILASRQPSASGKEVALGEMRAQELNRVTGLFILRRTQDLNNEYLPPKVEIVLFCRPTSLQLRFYEKLLSSKQLKHCLYGGGGGFGVGGESAQHLMCIAALKKLCNCPSLLYQSSLQAENHKLKDPYNYDNDLYSNLHGIYPENYDPADLHVDHCGKLVVLEKILKSASEMKPREKVVLVSNYTQTLDILELLCRARDYSFLRLDGQTPTTKRQQLVERFNSKHAQDCIHRKVVFLLSSKAGGVGLNLIGASRLVLYDIDWNPANDLQAMARIWRDGQTRTVYIYRLITTGSIEEKMYQRQVSKQGLSGVVVDAKANSKLQFSPEELKDLFRIPSDTLCATHDLLDCNCDGKENNKEKHSRESTSVAPNISNKNVCMDELMEWKHEQGPGPSLDHVDPLFYAEQTDVITYAFWNVSGGKQMPSNSA